MTDTFHWKSEWEAEEDGASCGPFWVERDGQKFYPLGHPDDVWVSFADAEDHARAHDAELVIE